MKRISGFFISALLLLSGLLCSAQDTTRFPINEMKGIRIGVDFSKIPVYFLYNRERVGFEATADMHIKGDFFATVETGWQSANIKKPDYHYSGKGFYGKIGTDYNLLKSRRPFSNDIVYAGARYAFSTFSHQAEQITVPGHFWHDATGLSMPKHWMRTHWMELLFGVKTEVLTNFYVGLTFRFKFIIVSPKDEYSKPYLIPGYGEGNENFAIGINYYVSYNIHF